MTETPQLTIPQAIQKALADIAGAIPLDELVNHVLRYRPSESKTARSRIKRQILVNEAGNSLAMLGSDTVVPLRVVMPGVRFRIVLSDFEIEHGVLLADAAFNGWHQRSDQFQLYELIDDGDDPVPAQVTTVEREISGLLGDFTSKDPAFDLGVWYRQHAAVPGDSLLITIRSWYPKRFELSLESLEEREHRQQEIQDRDQELADRLFDLLEEERYEDVHGSTAIPTAHARLQDPVGYPGSPWPQVIEADPRMRWDGFGITYADRFYPLELAEASLSGTPPITDVSLTPREAEQVLRLKVSLRRRKGLWRMLEVQGKQTLSELDALIRDAFEYDRSGCLSGFAKLIPRRNNRFREIEIGTINPHIPDGISNQTVASLGLQVGDRLRYVYDYNWPEEHEAQLEAVGSVAPGVHYPRVAERNKPRHRYCSSCQAVGKRIVADYRCLECAKPPVYVCASCLEDKHEDHYFEVMIY